MVKTLLSTQLTLSPRLLAPIKKVWELFRRCRLISTFGRKNMQVLGHDKTSRLIGSGPIRTPVRPSKGQSSVLQAIDHTVAGSMTAQPPGSHPSVLRVAPHGQQAALLGGGSYPSAYSTAPADRARKKFIEKHKISQSPDLKIV